MILQLGQQIEGLQAIDSQRFKEVLIGGKLLARHFEVSRGQAQDFVERFIGCWHKNNSIVVSNDHGKYGCASLLSTNFFNPACTAGRENRSQKISISRCSSSCGIGLMNCFAAAAVWRSNFAICAAVARAARRASPSATT